MIYNKYILFIIIINIYNQKLLLGNITLAENEFLYNWGKTIYPRNSDLIKVETDPTNHITVSIFKPKHNSSACINGEEKNIRFYILRTKYLEITENIFEKRDESNSVSRQYKSVIISDEKKYLNVKIEEK
jgi:hypothetical protein